MRASLKRENTAMKKTKLKALILCLGSVICGIILATLRINVLFGAFDNAIGLYPKDESTAVFDTALIITSILLLLGGLLFCERKSSFKLNFSGIAMTFAHSFLGFCFLGLGFSSYITAKMNEIPLSRLDAVLVILSLVCTVSYFMEAFGRGGQLGHDATTVLMLFRPVCCLFISFYFYFDSTTVIHNSNKKLATLFFALVLLTLLSAVKFRVQKPKMATFMSFVALSVSCGIMYFVPDLVWFFSTGEGLMLSVFFDVLAVALTIWCCVCILSLKGTTEITRAELLSSITHSTLSDTISSHEVECDELRAGAYSEILTQSEYAYLISDKVSIGEILEKNHGSVAYKEIMKNGSGE